MSKLERGFVPIIPTETEASMQIELASLDITETGYAHSRQLVDRIGINNALALQPLIDIYSFGLFPDFCKLLSQSNHFSEEEMDTYVKQFLKRIQMSYINLATDRCRPKTIGSVMTNISALVAPDLGKTTTQVAKFLQHVQDNDGKTWAYCNPLSNKLIVSATSEGVLSIQRDSSDVIGQTQLLEPPGFIPLAKGLANRHYS